MRVVPQHARSHCHLYGYSAIHSPLYKGTKCTRILSSYEGMVGDRNSDYIQVYNRILISVAFSHACMMPADKFAVHAFCTGRLIRAEAKSAETGALQRRESWHG